MDWFVSKTIKWLTPTGERHGVKNFTKKDKYTQPQKVPKKIFQIYYKLLLLLLPPEKSLSKPLYNRSFFHAENEVEVRAIVYI